MGGKVFVKFDSDMFGVFVKEYCKKGTVMRQFSDHKIVDAPTRTSIQIAEGRHAEDEIGTYVNHACQPSCEVRGNQIVALQDLKKGDEITFNYSVNESAMASPFVCKCCGKLITGRLGAKK